MERRRSSDRMDASKFVQLLAALAVLALIQSSQALDDVYNAGPFEVDVLDVAKGARVPKPKCRKTAGSPKPTGTSPPRRLLVAVPKQSGTFPVIHFQHGFLMLIDFYTQLLKHVASYGYIVIAPQMALISSPDATNEIAGGADTLDWYPNNLAATIGELQPNLNITPDLSKVILAGHSRGGKVAFGLATGVCKTVFSFSGIVGFDPVDGFARGWQTKPKILPNKQFGLKLPFPTLIVGTALGAQRSGLFPPCAPLGVSQGAFFNDSAAPAYHFVARDYGHMDYLDDHLCCIEGLIASISCKNGPSRAPMRQFAGGILVAFLDAILSHNATALDRALENIPSAAPVILLPPQFTNTSIDDDFEAVRLRSHHQLRT